MGRPTKRTKRQADEICAELAKGKTLSQACRDNPQWIARSKIYEWLLEDQTFRDNYARARDIGESIWWDEITDLADGCKPDANHINLTKLRIDARKYRLAVDKPRKYSLKIEAERAAAEPLPRFVVTEILPKDEHSSS